MVWSRKARLHSSMAIPMNSNCNMPTSNMVPIISVKPECGVYLRRWFCYGECRSFIQDDLPGVHRMMGVECYSGYWYAQSLFYSTSRPAMDSQTVASVHLQKQLLSIFIAHSPISRSMSFSLSVNQSIFLLSSIPSYPTAGPLLIIIIRSSSPSQTVSH